MKTTLQSLLTALVVAAVLLSGASSITSCSKTSDPSPNSSTTSTLTFPGVNTYSSITMGDQGATAASYWNSSTGAVVSSSNFATSINSIDLTFVTVPTNNPTTPTLASPDQRSTLGLTVNTNSTVTTFIGTASAAYAAYTDGKLDSIATPSTKSVSIVSGSTYVFKTQAGKKGVLKVSSISTATGSSSQTVYSVTFDAKVQK